MLRYSKDRPTVPGFYFVMARGVLSGNVYQTVVHVYKSNEAFLVPDRVSLGGENYLIGDERGWLCFIEFAGPITEPVVNLNQNVTEYLKGVAGLIAAFISEDNVYVVCKEVDSLDWIELGDAEAKLARIGVKAHVRFQQNRKLDEMFPRLEQII
jgi:hypothetical protein